MRRVALAAAAALFAFPASALAASSSGVVLSVDTRHHAIQVVDSTHIVHAYGYQGRLPKLHAGTVISFRRTGLAINHVTAVSNQSRSVAFYGRVVRSSSAGLVLRLADGRLVTFSSKQITRKRVKPAARHKRPIAHAADLQVTSSGVTVNIQGLQPGVTVLITESVDSLGNVTITITLPGPSAPVVNGEQQASGVVTEVDSDAFVVLTGDGSSLRLHMAQNSLANLALNICDGVDVTYHQDAGLLIADNVNDSGPASSSDCSGNQTEQDVVGAITQVTSDSVTINSDRGDLTFSLDPSSGITQGFGVGDLVDVTYSQNSDGSLSANDVEYVERDATGVVTAVSNGAVTITDDNTGQPAVFAADPSLGLFDGVAVGDQVDVTYHQSGGQLVTDALSDGGGSD